MPATTTTTTPLGMPPWACPPGMSPRGMSPRGMSPRGMSPRGMSPRGIVPPGHVPPGHVPPGHVHDETCGHVSPVQAWREGGLLSVAVGLIPCSGAVLILVYCLANGLLLSGVLMAGAIAVGMGDDAVGDRHRRDLRPPAGAGDRGTRGRSGSGRPRAALGLIGPALITLFGAAMLVGSL